MSRTSRLIHPESIPGLEPEYYEVDLDNYMEDIRQLDNDSRFERMNSYHFWDVTLRHMPHNKEEMELFMVHFFEVKAETQREYALKGSRTSKSRSSIVAFQIYRAAKAIGFNRAPENHFVKEPEGDSDFPKFKPLEKTSEGRLFDSELIGDMIADRVHWGSTEVFKKLASFVEDPPCQQADKCAFRLISFFDFVLHEFRLPTKAEIKWDWGVSDKQANRYRNEVGLKGLPQKK